MGRTARLACGLVTAMSLSGATLGADQTLTGQITDSMCKAKHEEAAEGAGKMADHDCTVSCVKGGSKYVLLADGKIYQIANQAFSDVEKLAGQTVKMTGEVKGDAITVTSVEPAKR